MKLSYYPGCTLKTKARALEVSAVSSMAALGVELVELPRWNCCGTVYSLAEDDLMHHLASVRNLVRVQEQGGQKVVTLCAFCYNTLSRVNLLVKRDSEKLEAINRFMDEEPDYIANVDVVHLLEVLRDDVGWDEVSRRVNAPLADLKVASYYGCTLLRPAEAAIEPPGRRTVLPDLLKAMGATPVAFRDEDVCCGSYQVVGNPDVVLNRARDILTSAGESGADLLAVSCPLCASNLGQKQRELMARESIAVVPIVYFTQLMALSLGLGADACLFDSAYGDPRPVLESRGLLPFTAVSGDRA
jgi:heterodisulfide reductase subunit B